jgi:hypothetical protein
VPEKSASLPLVHAAAPESQFSAETSQTLLFVPDHVCVAASAEGETPATAPMKIALAARWSTREGSNVLFIGGGCWGES